MAAKLHDLKRPQRHETSTSSSVDAGHALGLGDGRAHRLLGLVEIGDDAGLDARASAGARRRARAGRRQALPARLASSAAMMQATLLVPMSRTPVTRLRPAVDLADFSSSSSPLRARLHFRAAPERLRRAYRDAPRALRSMIAFSPATRRASSRLS